MRKNLSQTEIQGNFKGERTCERLLSVLDSICNNFASPYFTSSLEFSPVLSKSKFINLELSSIGYKSNKNLSSYGSFENFPKDKPSKPNQQLLMQSRIKPFQGHHSSLKKLGNNITDSYRDNGELPLCSEFFVQGLRPKTSPKINRIKQGKFYRDFGKSVNKTYSIPQGKLEIEGKQEKSLTKSVSGNIRIKRIIETPNKIIRKRLSDSKINKSITCDLDSPNELKIETPIIKLKAKNNLISKEKVKNSQKMFSPNDIEPW
ncbi:unnamed protein product [Blepharisma stoltei]|uniref:Uncharacterized protein n=1 Tax=Blepharisma stoltei TaxID=1481888 RepID=A0AAU9JXP1_9CILI|nr:unnamed protein product [Blepharisma stoltei]